VFQDVLKIVNGNVRALPATSAREFGYPTLTPTLDQVVGAVSPFVQDAGSTIAPSSAFRRLGVNVFDYLLNTRFEPNTNRQASAFVMDLNTGQAVSLVPNVAYSGMSLIKIPILVEVYHKLEFQPEQQTAIDLAQMMICSSNDATNAMLGFSGDGDMLAGTGNVTKTMQALGLKNTFITSPIRSDPRATAVPVGPFKTQADQTSTDPDPFNQSTPADLGYLLSSIYYCAKDGTGALITGLGGAITQEECKKMVLLLTSDKIGVMIEAGVPDTAQVAHKHGWVEQTMGDAGIVYTPGGDFVLVVMMSERPVLRWTQEFPRVSEITRTVYNYYNPGARMMAINPKTIPEDCTLPDELLKALRDL
jgi:beta-lactamase class A